MERRTIDFKSKKLQTYNDHRFKVFLGSRKDKQEVASNYRSQYESHQATRSRNKTLSRAQSMSEDLSNIKHHQTIEKVSYYLLKY